MNKRKSLGRGLEALLGSSSVSRSAEPQEPGAAAVPKDGSLRELPVDLLSRGRYQPRVDMREETLAELAESIRAQGIVQPIVVRPLPRQAARRATRSSRVSDGGALRSSRDCIRSRP